MCGWIARCVVVGRKREIRSERGNLFDMQRDLFSAKHRLLAFARDLGTQDQTSLDFSRAGTTLSRPNSCGPSTGTLAVISRAVEDCLPAEPTREAKTSAAVLRLTLNVPMRRTSVAPQLGPRAEHGGVGCSCPCTPPQRPVTCMSE